MTMQPKIKYKGQPQDQQSQPQQQPPKSNPPAEQNQQHNKTKNIYRRMYQKFDAADQKFYWDLAWEFYGDDRRPIDPSYGFAYEDVNGLCWMMGTSFLFAKEGTNTFQDADSWLLPYQKKMEAMANAYAGNKEKQQRTNKPEVIVEKETPRWAKIVMGIMALAVLTLFYFMSNVRL